MTYPGTFPDVLTTSRLVLYAVRPGHEIRICEAVKESLNELQAYPASLPWAMQEPTLLSTSIFCKIRQEGFAQRQDFTFLIADRFTSYLHGCAGIHRLDEMAGKAELGYWCRTSSTGRGIMTEAVHALCHFAFTRLSMKTLEIITDEHNSKSRRLAERCGFRLTETIEQPVAGMLRRACVYKMCHPGPVLAVQ